MGVPAARPPRHGYDRRPVLTVCCDTSRLSMQRPAGDAVYAAHVLERLAEADEITIVGAAEARYADALLNLDGRFRPGRGQVVVSTVTDLGHLFARRAYGPRRWLAQNWRVASAARRSDRVLVPSTAVRDGIERYLNVRQDRVVVLPPLPAAHFRRRGPAEVELVRQRLGLPTPYLLFVGTRSARKNLALLGAAWKQARVAPREVALVLAGPGRGGLPGAHDLGYVPAPPLAPLLSGALAWLNPSLYEGSAIGALEAMACGPPVVAAATGAQAHAVDLNGLLLPPDDVGAWAQALEAVVEDPALRRRLSAAGLRRVRELRASPPEVWPLVAALSATPRRRGRPRAEGEGSG